MKNDEVILYDPKVGVQVGKNPEPYIDYTVFSLPSLDVIIDTYSKPVKELVSMLKGVTMPNNYMKNLLDIEKIIVNGPATIVFFRPLHHIPEKIIVKRQEGDEPNLEKAILMAIVKRRLGSKYGIINQSIKKYPDDPELAVAYALLRKYLKGYEIRDLVKQGKDVLVDQTEQ